MIETDPNQIAWIRDGLAQPGKTQKGLATALGLDPSAVSRILTGARQLRAAELPVVAAYLDAEPPAVFAAPAAPARADRNANTASSPRAGGRNLPYMGNAVAGADGMFLMNGEVHDYIERPPSLEGVAGAYAVYVADTSMVPRYFPGETLHVHPGRTVTPGDDTFVVVQLRPDADGEAPRALVKQFVRRTADELVLRQFNPDGELVFPAAEVASVHLIIWAGRG